MLKFYLIEKILYWYWFHEKIQNYTIIYILFITETSPTTWKHGHTSTASIKQTWYSVSRYPTWIGNKWRNVKNITTTLKHFATYILCTTFWMSRWAAPAFFKVWLGKKVVKIILDDSGSFKHFFPSLLWPDLAFLVFRKYHHWCCNLFSFLEQKFFWNDIYVLASIFTKVIHHIAP